MFSFLFHNCCPDLLYSFCPCQIQEQFWAARCVSFKFVTIASSIVLFLFFLLPFLHHVYIFRHETYKGHYRAMFVEHCNVDKTKSVKPSIDDGAKTTFVFCFFVFFLNINISVCLPCVGTIRSPAQNAGLNLALSKWKTNSTTFITWYKQRRSAMFRSIYQSAFRNSSLKRVL
jgi:hypothetical protein